ncbi:hypothetical protein UFOVP826_21 [uncultured Caudovirales phage]|uniref:Uncharacterized protein n=1 Tax=uncultured Caudovirales phage TaxID=2100421 RepID=A0A6J5P5B0_9CAUD|nr:hypothetical protein UFOVP826_21 [uncultured Caudovirales phage]
MEIQNLVAVVGSYTKNGQEKKIYRTVGKFIQGDKGPYVLLNKDFNPAGVPSKEGSDTISLGIYDQKDKGEQSEHSKAKADGYQAPSRASVADDDIPFALVLPLLASCASFVGFVA